MSAVVNVGASASGYLFCQYILHPALDTIRAAQDFALKTFNALGTQFIDGLNYLGSTWIGPIAVITSVAFAIILVYAFYMYVNMSLEDHLKLRENLRGKHRKKQKHTRKK